MKTIPQDRWILFSHQIILHGRRYLRGAQTEMRGVPAESGLLRAR